MADNVDYLQKLTDDLIAQFRRQPNTRALMSTIARQLQDLHKVSEQLNVLRWLSKAEGKQLDGIGSIVVMSRIDAAKLELAKLDASEIDDRTYRKYLYYKMFLNTSTGTRKEIMKALRFFWNEAPLYYSEELDFPATIFVGTPELSPEIPIEELLNAPIVKPGGVRFIVRIRTRTNNDLCKLRHVGLSVIKLTETQMPEVAQTVSIKQISTTYAPQWKITRTDTGAYTSVVNDAKRYRGLATVKITNTPITAYGGG